MPHCESTFSVVIWGQRVLGGQGDSRALSKETELVMAPGALLMGSAVRGMAHPVRMSGVPRGPQP